MIAFSGAIGNAYQKFYEPFMSYKDEISLTLDLKPKNALGIQFNNILKKLKDTEIDSLIKDYKIDINDISVKELIKKGLETKINEEIPNGLDIMDASDISRNG
jgi:hypothetical protein